MAKILRSLLYRALSGPKSNLVCLEDPYACLQRLLRGHRVTGIVDAGASDGRVSRRLFKRFPDATIYAFEPQPHYHKQLDAFARRDRRFKPQRLALLDRPGATDDPAVDRR